MVLKRKYLAFISLVGLTGGIFSLVGCEKPQEANAKAEATWGGPAMPANMPVKQRWYNREQVSRGYEIFQANCAACHKPDASGTENWRGRDANGKLPPPPINGTAHAWHHSLDVLRNVVNQGGVPVGGTMPGFRDKLNKQEVEDVLAWVQSNWSDDIYSLWYERNEEYR